MTETKSIDQLKKEFTSLNERKIKTETQLDAANAELKKLQEEAIAEFETSDIEELEEKLKSMEQENEKRRQEYQTLLDGISTELKKIESESNATGGGPANG